MAVWKLSLSHTRAKGENVMRNLSFFSSAKQFTAPTNIKESFHAEQIYRNLVFLTDQNPPLTRAGNQTLISHSRSLHLDHHVQHPFTAAAQRNDRCRKVKKSRDRCIDRLFCSKPLCLIARRTEVRRHAGCNEGGRIL